MRSMGANMAANPIETHNREEKLRQDILALIGIDTEFSLRLDTIQRAMALIFGYTIDRMSRSDEEATSQFPGIRLFNAAASSIKLRLSGYCQPAFPQVRDTPRVPPDGARREWRTWSLRREANLWGVA